MQLGLVKESSCGKCYTRCVFWTDRGERKMGLEEGKKEILRVKGGWEGRMRQMRCKSRDAVERERQWVRRRMEGDFEVKREAGKER